MKTTIEIADELLRQAKATAKREKTTLRSVLENALRAHLSSRSKRKRTKFKPVVVRGSTPPEVFENINQLIRDTNEQYMIERLKRAGIM